MSEENKDQVEEIEEQDVKKPPQESTDTAGEPEAKPEAKPKEEPQEGAQEEEPAVDDSDDRIDLDEVVESENDFEMKNIIGFIIGFLVLVAGFITLGMGSTSLSPFLIIGGYIIIGVSLII